MNVRAGAVQIRWRTGESMEIALRGFGPSPRLIWSPSGRRFAVLETEYDRVVDRLLIVDPEQRRSRMVRKTRRAAEIQAATFLTDDRIVAQTFDSHRYERLTRLDAGTGRIVSSRYSLLPLAGSMDFSPAANRLAIEVYDEEEGGIAVVSLAQPDRTTRLKLTGRPTWSADGTRILLLPDGDVSPQYATVQLAAWPGGARVRVPHLFDARWLPDRMSLIGLEGGPYGGPVPRVVQVGLDGRVTHTNPVQWPESSGSYFATMIPFRIESVEAD